MMTVLELQNLAVTCHVHEHQVWRIVDNERSDSFLEKQM